MKTCRSRDTRTDEGILRSDCFTWGGIYHNLACCRSHSIRIWCWNWCWSSWESCIHDILVLEILNQVLLVVVAAAASGPVVHLETPEVGRLVAGQVKRVDRTDLRDLAGPNIGFEVCPPPRSPPSTTTTCFVQGNSLRLDSWRELF